MRRLFKKAVCILTTAAMCAGLFCVSTADAEQTGTDASGKSVYSEEYAKLLESPKYSDFAQSVYTDTYFTVPGLARTNMGDSSVSNYMVPQGMCIAGDYLLISAYDGTKDFYTEIKKETDCKRKKSVIYILDKVTGKYLTTLVLNSTCHVGAIAFQSISDASGKEDGRLFIADSQKQAVQILYYSTLCKYALSGEDANAVPCDFDCGFSVSINPSFVAYDSGYLYVGNYTDTVFEISQSKMCKLKAGKTKEDISNTVVSVQNIPVHTQGAAFAQFGDTKYEFYSTSSGRLRCSALKIYAQTTDASGKVSRKFVKSVSMPCMSEDICVSADYLLISYESGSNRYYSPELFVRSLYPMDIVTVTSLESLLGETALTQTAAPAGLEHDCKAVTKKATMTANGSVDEVCSVCKSTVKSTVINRIKSVKLSCAVYTYTGAVNTPEVTVKDSAGKKLVRGTDYTVSYGSGRKNVGRYAVKVLFKGKYSGSKTLYFTVKPAAASVKALSAGKNSFTVKWKKQTSQVSGYRVQYGTDAGLIGAKTVIVSKNSTVSKTVTGLKAGKKYYVRVGTYKTVNGKRYFSEWSPVLKVTIEK